MSRTASTTASPTRRQSNIPHPTGRANTFVVDYFQGFTDLGSSSINFAFNHWLLFS